MKNVNKLILVLFLIIGCSHKEEKKAPVVSQMATLTQAYEYGFPLVLMDLMKEASTNVSKPDPAQGRAPVNQFVHVTRVPTPNSKNLINPSVDSTYSVAWLDLSKGPIVVETADTKGRFFVMSALDAWSNVYATFGKRTTGTYPSKFILAGPDWNGDAPPEIKVFRCPTEMSMIIGRVHVKDSKDAKVARGIQQKFKLYPLRISDQKYVAPKGVIDPMLQDAPPFEKIFALSSTDFFNRLNRLMVKNHPQKEDSAILAKIAPLGIAPGGRFEASKLSAADQEALNELPANVRTSFVENNNTFTQTINGWMIPRSLGVYGTDYHKRALVSYNNYGANLDEDSLTATAHLDGTGTRLNGQNRYILHFNKDQLPKVDGYWSITVYDDKGMLVKNKIGRYSISDNSKLSYNTDGSLDIFVEHASPGKIRASNWLPVPESNFHVTARFYSPKQELLQPTWSLPAIMPAGKSQTLSLNKKDK